MQTRKPTGRPAWPMILIAGAEKAGKTYAAAAASGSDLIGDTYWLTCGEDDPDEYAPLGRFKIVVQPGTHRGIVESLREVVATAPADPARPNLVVIDSISMLWALLSDEAQQEANRRRERDEATIAPDLWNRAAKRWRQVMDLLRAHRGPSVLTARLAQVLVMDGDRPTGERTWRIEGHKTLPYDVSAIVQLRARDEAYLTAVRSMRMSVGAGDLVRISDFTVDSLWRQLGLADSTDRARAVADGATSLRADDEARAALLARLEVLGDMTRLDDFWRRTHGEPIAKASDLAALADLTAQGEARADLKKESTS